MACQHILMKNFFYFLICSIVSFCLSQFVSSPLAHAQETTINTVLNDEKNSHDITLTKATNLTFDSEEFSLQPVTAGLRKKKFFALVNVKFYFAELLAAYPQKIIKTETDILNSLKAAGPVEMKLTLFRDVPNDQIINYFTEAFKANSIYESGYSSAMKLFFEELKNIKQLNKNDVFSLIGLWKKDKTILVLQRPDKTIKTIEGDSQFLDQIYSVWLGEPADDKIKALKKDFLKN